MGVGTTGVQAALTSGTVLELGLSVRAPYRLLGTRITHQRAPRPEGASTYLEFSFGFLFLFLFRCLFVFSSSGVWENSSKTVWLLSQLMV